MIQTSPPQKTKASPKTTPKISPKSTNAFIIPKDTFNALKVAFDNITSKSELECKFKMPLDKSTFTHILQYYRSNKAFEEFVNDDQLDIFCKLPTMPSNTIRISILGKDNINEYCKTNSLSVIKQSQQIIYKKPVPGVKPINIPDIGFKVDLKDEIQLDDMKREELFMIIQTALKGFRYKKRFTYSSPDSQFKYDFSLTKTSSIQNDNFLCHPNFAMSGTFAATEVYEIEIEAVTLALLSKATTENIINKFIEAMTTIYLLYKKEQYYISPEHRQAILTSYLNLTFPNDKTALTAIQQNPRKYFAAPQPVTLEKQNLLDPALDIISIKQDYTVTEKADGERYLMFIDNAGAAYLIDSRMNIKFTGVKLQSIVNTLLDGEFVTRDTVHKRVKIFAVFDIYYYNSQDVRNNPLIPTRLNYMKEVETKCKARFQEKQYQFFVKQFLHSDNIFKEAETILTQSHHYPYEIDGLIFTPANLSVGASRPNEQVSPATSFSTWHRVFKYKPPEQNSIDFLVRFGSLSTNPTSTQTLTNPNAIFQELELYVGYNPLYPMQWDRLKPLDILSGKLANLPPRPNTYLPRRFDPPLSAQNASTAYVEITQSNKPKALNGDVIEDNTIVEFSWINEQWIPIRVRQDKTELLRKQGLSRTANDIKSALNVWQTINDPVTDAMIKGQIQVTPESINNNAAETYYFRSTARDKMATKKMLDFHNYHIKNKCLIAAYPPTNPSKPNKLKSILDIACGKAGDLNKWIDAGFKHILGIDYARDNIENPTDGAYARTLEKKQKERARMSNINYMYLTLDGGAEFTSAYFDTLSNPDDKYLAKLAWGIEKPGDNQALTPYYNFAHPKPGFDVVSCQFAIHYFFESTIKLDNFLANVANHLASGGYFIGTCLNANKIKEKMKQQSTDTLTGISQNDTIIWNIKKLSDTEVEIYMESINKRMKEYFVDFDLLVSKLQKYNINLVKPITSFEDEFYKLQQDSQQQQTPLPTIVQSILSMSPVEKEYSFLNSYFVFQKQ